jgi:hypothetical protein
MKAQKFVSAAVLPTSVKPLVNHLATILDAQTTKTKSLQVPLNRSHYVNGEGKQFVRELFQRLGWKVSFKHRIDGMMAGAAYYGTGANAGVNFPASAAQLARI